MEGMQGKIEAVRIGTSASALIIYGLSLNEWVAVGTLIYMGLQILVLLPKAFTILRGWARKIGGYHDHP